MPLTSSVIDCLGQLVLSRKVGLFSSEFSAENSDIQVFMYRGTDVLVNSYSTESTRP